MTEESRPSLLYRFLSVLIMPAILYYLTLVGGLFFYPLLPNDVSNPTVGLVSQLVCGLVVAPGTIIVGLLIIRRVQGNVVGPILVFFGVGAANAALGRGSNLFYVLFFSTFNLLAFRPLAFLAFFYPNGRVFPPRYAKIVDWWACLSLVLGLLAELMHPDHFGYGTDGHNPLFIPALQTLYDPLWNVLGVSLAVSLVLGLISLLLRYRRAKVDERLQIKWFLGGIVLVIMVMFTWTPLLNLLHPPFNAYFALIQIVVFAIPATTIGNAILRYRLYDIDIIIRRTLIYSILSAILALIFFGGVTITQQLIHTVTGQSSDLAIVVSTLAIAALYSPLRRRVQNAIDHRFYRRKYDAEKTLAQFSQTLRNETNLESLQASMIRVVQDTMQPNKVGLWLREKGQ